MLLKCIIFDIDGVLAEKSPERDYREYDKVDLDKPIETGFKLLNLLLLDNHQEYGIVFITGRKMLCRDKTSDFIINNIDIKSFIKKHSDIYKDMEYDWIIEAIKNTISRYILMRPDNDHRPAVVLKKELYETHIKGKYEVELAIDDDPEICEMWKQEGIFTLEVKR